MPLLNQDDIQFLLYDCLGVESLLDYERYSDHSAETFNQSIDTAAQIADKYFLDHNHKADEQEPWFDGEAVHTIPEVKEAFSHFVESGLLNSTLDYDKGGMQLPVVISSACTSWITAANPATSAYAFITSASANVIDHFATDDLKETYLPGMRTGSATGTMVLTEPDIGSSLGDMKTNATPTDEGHYLIKGQKMFISGGDHDLTDQIVHLVLARIKGAPAGVKGISLFLVPKWLPNEKGELSERNDVKLAGLLHKMGFRGTTSTVLNFGEEGQCKGFLIGEAHKGLQYMFMMMNEARIAVGIGAAVLGYRGYLESLQYAKDRPQGRLPGNKDSNSPQVPIVQHADVKRMLLAQKAYAEGSLGLCFFANKLVDEMQNSQDPQEQQQKFQLLDLITPIVKSWPSEYCCKANEHAIQILGGSGYIREYPVEQIYRDNRLNPIHEGTHGIQSLDLMGRKVWQNNGEGLKQLAALISQTVDQAKQQEALKQHAETLEKMLQRTNRLIEAVAKQIATDGPERTLSNSAVFLSYMGHLVMGWQWLWQASVACEKLQQGDGKKDFYQGKLYTCKWFFHWEIPQMDHWENLLLEQDDCNYSMPVEAF